MSYVKRSQIHKQLIISLLQKKQRIIVPNI